MNGPLGPTASAMSRVAGLSSKKSRWLLQSLLHQQRHSLGTGFESANILLSPKYHLKDKDLRKIHKAARDGDAARVHQLLLGKHCVNDKDKKKRWQGPGAGRLWRRRGLCGRKPPDTKHYLCLKWKIYLHFIENVFKPRKTFNSYCSYLFMPWVTPRALLC